MNDVERADISVIIPCFRSSETLQRCVKSVIDQTLLPHEIILIDDASGDQTNSVLLELQKEYGSQFIKIITFDTNKGPASARNAGWDFACSEFIAFLDADDAWHPNKILIQYSIMKDDKSIVASSHDVSCSEFEECPQRIDMLNTERVTFKKMLFKNSMPTRSVMLQRRINFRFTDGLRYAEDYRLWLDILAADSKVVHIKCILARSFKNDYGASGLSSNLWAMESGVQSNLVILLKNKKLSIGTYILVALFSVSKFLVRVITVKFTR